MITQEELQNVLGVIETHLVGYANVEVEGYKYGSYSIPQKYRGGVSYLELYYFVLTQVYDLLEGGLDYTEYGFTDESIVKVVDHSNELIFYYD